MRKPSLSAAAMQPHAAKMARMLAFCLQSPFWPGFTGVQRVLPGIIRSSNSHPLTVVSLVLLEACKYQCAVPGRHVRAHGMNKRGLVIQELIGCPAHLQGWRGKQGERLLQTRMQVVAESNQTATLLDACEGLVGHQLAPFGN